MATDASPINAFQNWMHSVGISWNTDAMTIVDQGAMLCSGLALGILAARDVKEGEELCMIPKAACISPLTTSIADIIQTEELGGGLGLVVAVLHEASLGAESKWAGYFAAMPQREYLPVFWNDAELALLQGTELEDSIESDRADVAEDFETHVLPLVQKYPERLRREYWTLENFHNAASLVASRAFGIDDDHGAGMVPLADVFNHKASVVDLAPEYAVHGEDSNSSEEEEELESEEDQHHQHHCHGDDCDHHNHDNHNHSSAPNSIMRRRDSDSNTPVIHQLNGISSANGLHLALEIAIVDADDNHLQIVAASDVAAGQEIHNTYGELSNAELVKKYGFSLRENPFNAVELDKQEVLEACKALYSGEEEKKAAKRQKKGSSTSTTFDKLKSILENETELLDEDEEPFVVLTNGYIGAALFVVLTALCSGAGEGAVAVKSLEQALTTATEDGKELVLEPASLRAVPLVVISDDEEDQQIIKPAVLTKMITPAMRTVLLKAIEKRLSTYPQNLENTQAALIAATALSSSSSSRLTEQQTATRAALTLRLSELELLNDAITKM